MAHGAPDDSNVVKTGVVHRIDDLAELAARLGSPNVWDRRGDVLFQSDFREGMGAFHSFWYGTGASVALVTGHSRQGAYSIRLRAGSDGDRRSYIQLAFPFQDPSKVGLEFSFAVAAQTEYVEAYIGWYDGTYKREGRVCYHHVDSELDYRDTGDAWADWKSDIALNECIRPEHTMKLVVDMATAQYHRFLLDSYAYSMAGIDVYEVASSTPPYWYFYIYHRGVATHTPDSFIDCVIVTQNEP